MTVLCEVRGDGQPIYKANLVAESEEDSAFLIALSRAIHVGGALTVTPHAEVQRVTFFAPWRPATGRGNRG